VDCKARSEIVGASVAAPKPSPFRRPVRSGMVIVKLLPLPTSPLDEYLAAHQLAELLAER